MTIQIDFSPNLAAAVVIGLVLVGVIYNQVVGWAEEQKFIEGFTSLAVALGVFLTLLGVAILSWQAALLTLAAFAATGTPMIAGSIWRYISIRKQEQDDDRQTARMAKHGQIDEGFGS